MNVRPRAQSKLGPTGKHPVALVIPIGLIWVQAEAVTYDYLGGTFGVVNWSTDQAVGGLGGPIPGCGNWLQGTRECHLWKWWKRFRDTRIPK